MPCIDKPILCDWNYGFVTFEVICLNEIGGYILGYVTYVITCIEFEILSELGYIYCMREIVIMV